MGAKLSWLLDGPRVPRSLLIVLVLFNVLVTLVLFVGDERLGSLIRPIVSFSPSLSPTTSSVGVRQLIRVRPRQNIIPNLPQQVETFPSIQDSVQASGPIVIPTPEDISADKVAMVVETRLEGNLVPLILHFSAVLGPDWHMVLFTMEEGWKMPTSGRFQKAIRDKRISVKFMPADTDMVNWLNVNVFLTRPWLWEQVKSASRALLFQTDSIICANSNYTIDDFLHFDYIGAPYAPVFGEGMNGGLSLRNPQLILKLLASPLNDFDQKWAEGKYNECVEDAWYYRKLKEIGNTTIPDFDTAKEFSVEAVWNEWPFGYHAPRMWHRKRLDRIRKYCPEVDLINHDNKTNPFPIE